MKEKAFAFRGKYLLSAVIIFYGVLSLFNSGISLSALKISILILMKVIPIFIAVILFTAMLNYFLKPKQIASHLGRESRAKAWLWALAAGVISHGPMYAWYPLLEDLRGHGMRTGLIVVFFFSRAVKIPLLPMMVDYFGWTFTVVLSLYILIGALIQGWILEMIEQNNGELK
ncbi:MAG: permease [Deltaproteobacteria bacterium]|nr:MAG: permease [Deltaproteobacteria bacterium]RLC22668.1 MAG: permease [Deltaproteobacteria bacterium]